MKTKVFFSILIGTTILSCGNKTKTDPKPELKDKFEKMKTIQWLVGKWEMKLGDTLSSENWVMKNDSTYTGISMDVVAGKDTIRFEQITIEQRGVDIFYVPVVKGQNDGKPVDFKMTAFEDKKLTFENPEHDFPKKIIYSISGDTLLPSIYGPMEGQDISMEFPMLKVK